MYADYIFLLLAYFNFQLLNLNPYLAKCFKIVNIPLNTLRNHSSMFSEHAWTSKCDLWTHLGIFTLVLWTHMGTVTFPSVFRERAWTFSSVFREHAYSISSVFLEHVDNSPSMFSEHAWVVSKRVQWDISELWRILLDEYKNLEFKH